MDCTIFWAIQVHLPFQGSTFTALELRPDGIMAVSALHRGRHPAYDSRQRHTSKFHRTMQRRILQASQRGNLLFGCIHGRSQSQNIAVALLAQVQSRLDCSWRSWAWVYMSLANSYALTGGVITPKYRRRLHKIKEDWCTDWWLLFIAWLHRPNDVQFLQMSLRLMLSGSISQAW